MDLLQLMTYFNAVHMTYSECQKGIKSFIFHSNAAFVLSFDCAFSIIQGKSNFSVVDSEIRAQGLHHNSII